MTKEEFAVIHTGGKQYKVKVGDNIKVEKLSDTLKKGDEVTFDKVLLVDNGSDTTIGTPYIKGASVVGVFESAGRSAKVMVVKYKQKSRYLKRNGHRQLYSLIKITSIK